MSPIENVWAYVQTEVNKKGCKTFAEFKAEVIKTMNNLPVNMTKNLYKSMVNRLADCSAMEGDMTKY